MLRWLKVRKVHGYSMNNQLLIALQKPDATRVAGFGAWLKLGRCVRKGEKAIKIFAPAPQQRPSSTPGARPAASRVTGRAPSSSSRRSSTRSLVLTGSGCRVVG